MTHKLRSFCLFFFQFDTSATAVIMTKIQNKDKYMKLMNGMEIIESRYYISAQPLDIYPSSSSPPSQAAFLWLLLSRRREIKQ